jgi:hypothetical protein
MGLTLGEVSGEESTFFCTGTESRLSDETISEAFALKRNYEMYYYHHYAHELQWHFIILQEIWPFRSSSTS